MNRDLTKGSVLKSMLLFSIPMILGDLLQQCYNIVDTLIVGQFLGKNALASVGSSFTLMTFITSIILGLCMGSGALFSIRYGQKDEKGLREDVCASFFFIALITFILTVISYIFLNQLSVFLHVPHEVWGDMKGYLIVIFIGIPAIFLYNYFASYLRAIGNSMIPLIFLAISAILNIGLDLFFVIVLKLGVEGAAIATVISQYLSGIGISIYSLIKNIQVRAIMKLQYFHLKRVHKVISFSVLTCIQQSVMNFGILMIQGLVNSFGKVIMAAFAAAVKIDTLAYMPAQEFANSYSLFVSQNFGAKERDRIKEGTKKAMITSVAFCFIISIIIVFAADNLMMLFVKSTEIETIKEGAKYLRIEGSMYIEIGILFLWYGYFRGINKPLISLILTIVSLGLRVLLSYSFAKTTPLGVIAIWCSIPIGWIIADITGLVLYKKYSKKALENI